MHVAGPRSPAQQAVAPEARLALLLDGLGDAERAAADEAVRELLDARAAAERELQELVYAASHDLTEPLRMVSSFLELLERRAGASLDDRSREFIAYATGGAARMRGLLDDLLRYSRVGTADLDAAPGATDVCAALGAACEALAPDIARVQAKVRVDGDLGWLRVDRTTLTALFAELVANAVEFRHPDRRPEITVSTGGAPRRDGLRAVTVGDNGLGITPAHQDRVWGVFTRLHAREEHPGNGIGLALVRRMVERHGGRTWIESDGDRGTVVGVLLPDGAGQ